ncbi:hypothetical protein ADICEAN_00676 [Cesiribacter andamanensis AMV16]|uniref:Uncharacterized protein n=1 Tax=Cesiribacter andamanensis AMV16 TaxID=1279009 RepID=M7NA65_9BACT|nr:hypothetical protein ADICEAN_00676 [Cesiribacter andamanensis AMV16]
MGRLRYFDIIYFIIACFAGYQLIQNLFGNSEPIFSYPITTGWYVLIFLFWSFWLLGSLGMVMKKKYSFLLLLSVSILSLIALVFSFRYIIYDDFKAQLIFYLELALAMLVLVDINLKRTKRMLGISAYGKYYLAGGTLFVFQALLFLLIDKH